MKRRNDPDTPRAVAGLAPCAGNALADATVLVVDDERRTSRCWNSLRDAGISNIHGLTDAREVVSRCLDLRPDLVLLDLHMPHMDGCAVLAALQAALPVDAFLPVLVLTADSSAAVRKDALDAGAKDFLTKPFDHVETILRVRNLLETGALYRAVQGHNARLQAELNEAREEEQRLSAERLVRRERIERVLRDGGLQWYFSPSSISTGAHERCGGARQVRLRAAAPAERVVRRGR